jgi:surface protein
VEVFKANDYKHNCHAYHTGVGRCVILFAWVLPQPSIKIYKNDYAFFMRKCNPIFYSITKKTIMKILKLSDFNTCASCPDKERKNAYAILKEGVLIFRYDNNKPEDAFKMNNDSKFPMWISKNSEIKTIIFENSFKDYTPKTCYAWFYDCINLTEIQNINNLNTSQVIDMGSMFCGCNSLIRLDVNNFDTKNVSDMGYMFQGCNSLIQLDVSRFDTRNVKYMYNMFSNCYSLKTILVGDNWNTKAVTSSESMFTNSNNLIGGKGTTYNQGKNDKEYARIDGGENYPGYFTKK